MTLTRYTPSLLPAEVLEALFVVRHRPLQLLMERVQQAADSDIRNHSLVVGPRGAGKTHLLSLVAHRTDALIEQGARLTLSWLPEDPWVIVSYPALLRAVLAHAGESVEPTLGENEAELRLAQRAAASGPIVVVVENLDQILTQIGEAGQQQLRSLLQTRTDLLLVASTTRLDRSLVSASEPFFQFFTTTALEPFTVDEARTMLQTIARHRGDDELVKRLESDEATARLRTVAHLAGGQPRLWSALADALTATGVRDLIDTLLTRFDDLTPYYQEQLARLSPNQRLTVAALASADHPVHVNDIAVATGIEQRSISKTLSELRDMGWVRPTDSPFARLLDARRTYYELAEPLARLSFQLKETRGEPLRLIVDFLTAWFDPSDADELDGGLYVRQMVEEFRSNATGSVIRRLSGLPSTRVPAVELLGTIDDALAMLSDGDPVAVLALPTPLRVALESRVCELDDVRAHVIDVRYEIHDAALEEVGSVPNPLSQRWIDSARSMPISARAHKFFLLLRWQVQVWDFEAAEATFTALELDGAPRLQIWAARLHLSRAHRDAGHLSQALAFAEAAREESEAEWGSEHLAYLVSLEAVGAVHEEAGAPHKAIPLYETSYQQRRRLLGGQHPGTLTSRNNLAGAYESAGDLERALPLYKENLKDREHLYGPDHPETLISRNNLAYAYRAAGQSGAAVELYERTLSDRQSILGPKHPDTLTSRNNLAVAYSANGDLERAMRLLESTVADSERILGPQHPETLARLHNLATVSEQQGKHEAAALLYERVFRERSRILGPDHPDTMSSRNSLAIAHATAGDVERAIPLFEENLTERERIFGANHASTLAARDNLARAYEAAGEFDRARALIDRGPHVEGTQPRPRPSS